MKPLQELTANSPQRTTMQILAAIAVSAILIALIIVVRRRAKKRRFVHSAQMHATGYRKYHPNTFTEIRRAATSQSAPRSAVGVLSFKGDLRASQRKSLSRFVDEIILNKARLSEVVLCLESPGGSVADYGHAYAELCRIRDAGLALTACVDTVAASGGYLMCLPANKILAAPFAMVGSIGVVSFIPNIRALLEKLSIQPRTFTAGQHKRLVTLTDDASPEQVREYEHQLELIHEQFKQALKRFRPKIDVEKVAKGDAWLASTTIELGLGLVDEIGTSASYLLNLNENFDLVFFNERQKRSGLSKFLGRTAVRTLDGLSASLGDILSPSRSG